jgi:hypothetical protein
MRPRNEEEAERLNVNEHPPGACSGVCLSKVEASPHIHADREMGKSPTISGNPTFRPAKLVGWIIRGAQILIHIDLAWRDRLCLEERDLDVLRSLPAGAGIILASNHADETDLRVCLELARRCRRRFLFMANREALDEGFGIAGWWLERLGCFSSA